MICNGVMQVVGKKRRILLADDDETDRELYSFFLSRAGYHVDTAADGEEAWNTLLSTCYDLLLTDYNMPCLSGLDLVARIRAAGITLPVIINSGCVELGEAADYPALGLAAIIQKSGELRELLITVASCLYPNVVPSESASLWWPRGAKKQTENSSLPRLAIAPWG